jgi:2-hydroxychromene-2-carboxylate isomerase
MPDPPPLFFFGAMSPYSWLAAERIGALLPEAQWRPVFAGGVFNANGRTSWGLTDEREASIAACEARAAQHGLGPLRWPDPWPTLDVLAGRAMLFAEREGVLRPFALSLMRMAFREGRDLADLDVVLEAARRVGLDPARVEHAVQDPELKAALRTATDAAVALGVFGVPTVVVGDELFWGDDRLEDAARAAAR